MTLKIRWKIDIAGLNPQDLRSTQDAEKKKAKKHHLQVAVADLPSEYKKKIEFEGNKQIKTQNLDMYKKANELLQKKYGLGKNKHVGTRESKVILNQE